MRITNVKTFTPFEIRVETQQEAEDIKKVLRQAAGSTVYCMEDRRRFCKISDVLENHR